MRYVIGAVVAFVVCGALELAGLHFIRYLLTGISAEFGLGFATALFISVAVFAVQRRRDFDGLPWYGKAYAFIGIAVLSVVPAVVTVIALFQPEPGQIIAGLLVGAWMYPLARFAGRVEDREDAEAAAAEAAHRSFP